MFKPSANFPVPGIYEVSIRGTCVGRQVRHVDEDGNINRPSGYSGGWNTQTKHDTYYDVVFESSLDGTPPLCKKFPIAGVYEVILSYEECIRHVLPDGSIMDENGIVTGEVEMDGCYNNVKYIGPLPAQPVVEHPQFWLVWCPTGPTPPSFRHPTELSASKEAERLAKEHPGYRFYVLAANAFCEHQGFEWTVLESVPQEVPF